MNGGIIRHALTTTLPLELEYREPGIYGEIGADSAQPTELEAPRRLFEDGFTRLPSMFL